MSRVWGPRSQHVYDTLDSRLQRLMTRLRDEAGDISLVSGHRGEIEQDQLFLSGASTKRYPDSKHNSWPSKAVDFQPHPYPTNEKKLWGALGYLAGRAFGLAKEEGIKIRWGGDWNGDGDLTNQKFDDLFHIEVLD